MLALVHDGRLHLDPRRPEPARGHGDALIRVTQAGIGSTELEIVAGRAVFSGVLGHEFVGVVESSPERALIGKRVVGEIDVACGRCDLCAGGLSNHCRQRATLGVADHDGAFAELVRLPTQNLHLVPDRVDDDMAVFTGPLAGAFQIVRQLGPKLNEKSWVTVLGSGVEALLAAQVLRNAGVKVRVVGRNDATLALCEKWQIKSRRLADVEARADQDVVLDCTGSSDGLALCVAMCRPRGTVVLKSNAIPGASIDLAPVIANEITLLGSRCGPFRPALQALAERAVDVTSLIARRMKLADGVAAMELAAQRGVLKVILTV